MGVDDAMGGRTCAPWWHFWVVCSLLRPWWCRFGVARGQVVVSPRFGPGIYRGGVPWQANGAQSTLYTPLAPPSRRTPCLKDLIHKNALLLLKDRTTAMHLLF